MNTDPTPKNHEANLECLNVSPRIASVATALLLALLPTSSALADTVVQGNVSGVWSKSLSPYRMVDNCTVPSRQTLVVEPGVIVRIDSGFSLTVNGTILAVGSQAEPIIFKSRLASNRWNQIYMERIQPEGGADSRFVYCHFLDATNAVYMCMLQRTETMAPEFSNCIFSNCVSGCIFGVAYAEASAPTLSPQVRNCRFQASPYGIVLSTRYEHGRAFPVIENNIFEGLSDTAIWLDPDVYSWSSAAQISNNLFRQCPRAIVTVDPYDNQVHNNIFLDCGYALTRYGALSLDVRYNCFFNNKTNFDGFSSPAYGRFDDVNPNGTTADVFMNISQDPMFAEMNSYTLSPVSPCIDAGNPATNYSDVCFPPGRIINDIGPNGGPYPLACALVAPTITNQPTSVASCIGGSASFGVGAGGGPPLRYQWHFQNTSLQGETNAWLTLTNLQAGQAGQYFVVVGNSSGSVTSSSAQLLINDACVDIHMYAGLTISGQAGQAYVLKYTTDLANTNFSTWTPLATNILGASPWFYLDMDSPFSPRRFYGVKKQ